MFQSDHIAAWSRDTRRIAMPGGKPVKSGQSFLLHFGGIALSVFCSEIKVASLLFVRKKGPSFAKGDLSGSGTLMDVPASYQYYFFFNCFAMGWPNSRVGFTFWLWLVMTRRTQRVWIIPLHVQNLKFVGRQGMSNGYFSEMKVLLTPKFKRLDSVQKQHWVLDARPRTE